ncbi:MAG: ABC transporter ATP-binding protein [Candidatus Margulisbacteria bacterium]|nr:ABC transporter ATP-binding protein [Candidatus Margulisiibacteriota bacterium]
MTKFSGFFQTTKLVETLRVSFQYSLPSLGLAWRSSKKLCVLVATLTLIASGLPLVIAYISKVIIDAIVAKTVSASLAWVCIEGAVVIIQTGVLRFLFLCQSLLGAKLGADVNILILEKAVTLNLSHFEDSEVYDQLTRARQQASVRPVAMVTDTLQLVQNTLTFFGYVGLLFSCSPWMVCGLILAAIPATVSEMRFSNSAFRLRNRRSPDTRRLNYLEYVLATDEHVKEVKVLGLSELFLGRYKALARQFYSEDKTLSVQRSKWSYFLSLLATGTFYTCYGFLALWTALAKITLGQLTLYIMAFRHGQQTFQTGLTAVGNMYEGNLYMSNLFTFLSIPTSIKEPISATNFLSTEFFEYGIRFEDVGFQYPGKTNWALRHISLFIPKGQSLALVGHNGAGKSTLIKLILRLYSPTEGRILLDGIDIRHWPSDHLYKRMGVVFQDFNQYQLTVRENVGVGSVPDMSNDTRVKSSIERGGADPVIEELPQGIETQLGRWFNAGMELSGGQWQKIALSRGFMREDADILILDEPTAALDAEAEQAVFQRFSTLTKGKTSLLISHRFPTVRMADRIVVIEGGQILEEGTHETLMQKQNGRYAHLFTLQAQGYL